MVATAAVVLALVQVTTAARMWGRLGFLRMHGSAVATVHRWSGRLAFLFTLPVFFHCVTILGFETPDTRVAVHSVAGTLVYGVFAAKMLIVRDRSLPGWALPAAGVPWRRSSRSCGLRPASGTSRTCGSDSDGTPSETSSRRRRRRGRDRRARAGDRLRAPRRHRRQASPAVTCTAVRSSSSGSAQAVTAPGAKERSVGPPLIDTGLDAAEVAATIEQGRGIMPPALVSGEEQADAVAYVVAISQP